jgi:hypothetical protein
MTMGTMVAARAITDGIRKVSAKDTRMMPSIMAFTRVPTRRRMRKATRFSSPVLVIAAAIARPADTNSQPLLEKPLSAIGMALAVPTGVPTRPVAGEPPRLTINRNTSATALAP